MDGRREQWPAIVRRFNSVHHWTAVGCPPKVLYGNPLGLEHPTSGDPTVWSTEWKHFWIGPPEPARQMDCGDGRLITIYPPMEKYNF